MKKYKILYNQEEIEFYITRKNVKNINLKVHKDLSVEVVANKNISIKYIYELVEKKATWIIKSRVKIEKNNENKKDITNIKYNTGDIIYYWGREYKLVVLESNKQNVDIFHGEILLYIKDIEDTKKKESVIYSWYRERALVEFENQLKRLYPYVKQYDINYPQLKIRKMKSCWGTCHYNKGFIVLNTELIKYDIEKIEYVIIHELMHFIYHNHSKEFHYNVNRVVNNIKS